MYILSGECCGRSARTTAAGHEGRGREKNQEEGAGATADRAESLLAGRGSIPVEAAGPYVEVGTYRIQVAVKLGRPAARLPDGTWLYENFVADGSNARGTLVVRFAQGRVSSLMLATPAVVAALRSTPQPGVLVAQQDRR